MAEVKVVGVALALALPLPEALPLELPVAEALLSVPVMLSRAEVPPVEMSERMEEASVGMAPPDSVMELKMLVASSGMFSMPEEAWLMMSLRSCALESAARRREEASMNFIVVVEIWVEIEMDIEVEVE
ncbi:hypothetical protein ASPVEDRAFT_334783 [Aspergillus versicolor CBS 583.65]|uniref:Secreted protein n=1 Tax=Aspergillus versicolor CBS 583.65 TaxID=1036611 RepID=A0A1L9PZ45_ASPVE|nr:uncharacterized protein ASPVEDRAFT_334783 [Aspergillus versicolor CBS 583.65]OJJ06735.1 hypothetical protein ASPVEDRAFT_334783 [Aspergillus versicolor CBS 583.65]